MSRLVLLFIVFDYCSQLARAQAPDLLFQFVPDGTGNSVLRRWVYVMGDEFSGNSLDEAIWQPSSHSRAWSDLQYYNGLNNISVSEGSLKLTTKEEPGFRLAIPWESPGSILSDGEPNYRHFQYTSGEIQMRHTFKRGLFWASMKPPYGKGTWPAFWLYGGNPNEEFDIFEGKGERSNEYSAAVHCPNDVCSNAQSWITVSGDIRAGYNSYFGEWGPNAVFWNFNQSSVGGHLVELEYQARLILNLAISKHCECLCCETPVCFCCEENSPFCGGPNDNTSFPLSFEVDFVRSYAVFDCEEDVDVCDYISSPTSPTVMTGRTLTIGQNCNSELRENDYLTLIASEAIVFGSGFIAQPGSYLTTKVIPCQDLDGIVPMADTSRYYALADGELNPIAIDENSVNPVPMVTDKDQQKMDMDQGNEMLLWPNPGSHIINIRCETSFISRCAVLDLHGRVLVNHVPDHPQSTLELDAKLWPEGMYCVNVQGVDGVQMTERLIIFR